MPPLELRLHVLYAMNRTEKINKFTELKLKDIAIKCTNGDGRYKAPCKCLKCILCGHHLATHRLHVVNNEYECIEVGAFCACREFVL